MTSALASTADSPEYVSLEPKFCENCGRTFLRRRGGRVTFCNGCRSTYHEYDGQLWGCTECGTERKYGDFRPENTKGKQLHCDRCGDVTEHKFSRITSQ